MGMLWNLNVAYYGSVSGKSGYYGGNPAGTVIDTIETNLGGKKMPVMHFNWQIMSNGVAQHFIDGGYQAKCAACVAINAVPFITVGTWDLANRKYNYDLRPAKHADGTWDSLWTQIFTEIKNWGGKVDLRLPWEFNVTDWWQNFGNFPWCVGTGTDGNPAGVDGIDKFTWTNTPADLKGMFLRIAQIRDSVGAFNASLVWCPNVRAGSGKTFTAGALLPYWPGVRANGTPYMDKIGFDGYQDGYGCDAGSGVAGGNVATALMIFRGGHNSGFLDSWGEALALPGASKIPFYIPETNVGLTGSFITRAVRALYVQDALEVGFQALPNLGMVSWFWWWFGSGSGEYCMDLTDSSPTDGSSPATFNTANVDFVQFAKSMQSGYWIDRSQYAIPSGISPLLPVHMSDQSERHRKMVRSTLGLRAFWRFNEASGTFADDTGNGHTGTAAGTVSYNQAGIIPANNPDGSLGLNGVIANHVDVGNATDLTPGSSFSIAGTFKCPAYPGTGTAYIYGKGAAGQIEWSAGVSSDGNFLFGMWTPTGTGLAFLFGPVVSTGVEHDFAVTIEGTAVELTIDGNVASKTTTTLSGSCTHGTQNLWIGSRNLGSPDQGWSGQLQALQVYNTKLSDLSITEQHKIMQPGPVITALAAA